MVNTGSYNLTYHGFQDDADGEYQAALLAHIYNTCV